MPEIKKMKITFETQVDTKVLDVHGIAGIAFTRSEDGYESNIILAGNMSVKDMLHLNREIQKELLPLIQSETIKDMSALLKGGE